jgi:hypothetical protein
MMTNLTSHSPPDDTPDRTLPLLITSPPLNPDDNASPLDTHTHPLLTSDTPLLNNIDPLMPLDDTPLAIDTQPLLPLPVVPLLNNIHPLSPDVNAFADRIATEPDDVDKLLPLTKLNMPPEPHTARRPA